MERHQKGQDPREVYKVANNELFAISNLVYALLKLQNEVFNGNTF